MGDTNNPINNYTETSTSSSMRTRATDKQMGLGTHNFFKDKPKKDKEKSNS